MHVEVICFLHMLYFIAYGGYLVYYNGGYWCRLKWVENHRVSEIKETNVWTYKISHIRAFQRLNI